jgi:hypothetical protein
MTGVAEGIQEAVAVTVADLLALQCDQARPEFERAVVVVVKMGRADRASRQPSP